MDNTLKAEELRIGNIVNKKFAAFTKTEESYWEWSYFRIEEFLEIQKYPELFAPIELSHEWLERMGFENIGKDDWRISEFRIRFTNFDCPSYNLWTNGDSEFCESIGNDIKYVHQLQNLYFALCGSELVLKQ